VISDHADWDDILRTIKEVNASEIWVTHGREDALIHACSQMGLSAKALSLIGYEDESE
jgi:putative mRNA 3-end processing factor